MNFAIFFKRFKLIKFRRLGITFASIFGSIWLFLEPAGLFLPKLINWGWKGYFGLAFFSSVIAITLNFPRKSVSGRLSAPDSTIEIKIGNLFDEPGHLVIGANDVFDTELGEVIKSSSVQGQLLTRVYDGNQGRLDAEIDAALQFLPISKIQEINKTKGKTLRYPIGTTIALGTENKRYFLSAYGYMGNDLRVKSTADNIWCSLIHLWEEVRLKGHGLEVAMPVIGSDLARTNLPRMALAQLIIISFIAASKKEFITTKLTIVIRRQDLESIDFYALEDFLKSTCF